MTGRVAGTLGRVELPVDAVKVAEFARALRYSGTAVPPMFTVVAAHHTEPGASPNELIIAAAGLDKPRVLLGSISWTVAEPLRRGDELVGVVALTQCEERTSRSGGLLRIAHGRTDFRTTAGEPRVTVDVDLIEAPPARARAAAGAAGRSWPAAVGDDALVLSRTDIVRYAGASGDFNPMHHDAVAARRLGFPDVFAMGLLPGGIVAARAAERLGELHAVTMRFRGIVWPDVPYRVEQTPPDARPAIGMRLIDPAGAAVLDVKASGGQTR
jgi:acyl dehydratase